MRTIGVLISGRGTNLQALIDATKEHKISATIGCVVSNKAEAAGIERARSANLPVFVIPHQKYPSREAHEEAIIKILKQHHVELVVLAGYMRLLTPRFIHAYPRAILNIHPALLPSFKGTQAQKQAVDYGVKISGCTVHFVDDEADHGPIVIQTPVEVRPDDTDDSLSERILPYEHQAIVEATRLWCEDRLEIQGRKVIIHMSSK